MIGAATFLVPLHGGDRSKPPKPVEVAVFEATEDSAPPAFAVTGRDGRRTLRLFEGRFYARFGGAPWVGAGIPCDGQPALSGRAIGEYLSHRTVTGDALPEPKGWTGDPLSFPVPRPTSEADREFLADPVGRMRYARAAAAVEYAVIDGDLHRHVQEPCWLVTERVSVNGVREVGPEASVPTYAHHLGVWRFRGDRVADAVSFAKDHVERRLARGDGPLRTVPPVGSIECLLAGTDFLRKDAVQIAMDRGEDLLAADAAAGGIPSAAAPEAWGELTAALRALHDDAAVGRFFEAAERLDEALAGRDDLKDWVAGMITPLRERARFDVPALAERPLAQAQSPASP